MPTSIKSKTSTALLALFLGGFGVHRFYVEKPGTGVAMLLITISIIGAPITAIWALVDLVLVLTGNFKDGHGFALKQ